MRKTILNIHLYGGLLCSAYLIIFGWSSLCFNHRSLVVGSTREPTSWEQPLALTPPAADVQAADAVRDALGLMGWPLPWNMKRDPEGNLHFDMERPGKSYTIHALFREGKARIEARTKLALSVVNSLHAIMDLPNSRFVGFWGYYTEICTWVVLFGALSGIYLWAVSKRERRVGIITVVAALAFSGSLIFYLIFRG